MSKKSSAGDRQKPLRWVKFIGSNAEQWKKILSQITIEKVPLDYVSELRFHSNRGQIHLYEVNDADESYIESLIEKTCNDYDVSAIEYIINLDRLNKEIITQVKMLIKGSKDD